MLKISVLKEYFLCQKCGFNVFVYKYSVYYWCSSIVEIWVARVQKVQKEREILIVG